MVNVILHGYSGRMGKMILDLVKDDPEICVAAGVDAFETKGYPFPVFSKMEDCTVKADVVIDFSVAAAVDDLLDWCVREKTACVLCTTGLDERQLARMKQASAQVAILKSANMSLGINLLMKLLKEAASVLAPAGFDIEIVEKHHNMKLDAPSGTALALGDSVREALDGEYENVFDRSRRRLRRRDLCRGGRGGDLLPHRLLQRRFREGSHPGGQIPEGSAGRALRYERCDRLRTD